MLHPTITFGPSYHAYCFGRFVRQRRAHVHLTQTELARKLHRSQQWLAKVEAGRHRTIPSLDVLMNLADALDVPLLDVLESAGADIHEWIDWSAAFFASYKLPDNGHFRFLHMLPVSDIRPDGLTLPVAERHLPSCRRSRTEVA
jgi:transcriptional regulator with XRE-family HTH domain